MSRVQMRHPVQEHAGAGDIPVEESIPPPDYSASAILMAVPPGIVIGFALVLLCVG